MPDSFDARQEGLRMPWKELSEMDAKVSFVADCVRGEEPMTVLCERHRISRQTGYLWKQRYALEGADGLAERSRAPHRLAHSTPAEIVDQLVALREKHPYWGARKLLELLRRRDAQTAWPAASTVTDILKRAGLVRSPRRRRHAVPPAQPFAAVNEPNDTWCIDFKGWFRTANGERCDPLTVTDAHSRYILALKIMPERSQPVREAVDALFAEYGLPHAMRSDNGVPFASNGAGGLSKLSVHWAKLGIRLERITPGQPQQNGRHERMHATLKAETTRPAAGNAAAQQARFDRFRTEFNHDRPHEALGQRMPAEHYRCSLRQMPDRVPEPWYDAEHAVRRVRPTGEIKWGGERVFISEALAGEPVGIAETEGGDWLVRFASVDLGLIKRGTKKLNPFAAVRPPRGTRNIP
jgi:putative transposase